jgi:hypothetical protein
MYFAAVLILCRGLILMCFSAELGPQVIIPIVLILFAVFGSSSI